MKHQKCVKCGHKFTYKERFYACQHRYGISCKTCGTKYKTTFASELLLFLLFMGFILFERQIDKVYDIPLSVLIIASIAIILFLKPTFVSFKLHPKSKQTENKEQKES